MDPRQRRSRHRSAPKSSLIETPSRFLPKRWPPSTLTVQWADSTVGLSGTARRSARRPRADPAPSRAGLHVDRSVRAPRPGNTPTADDTSPESSKVNPQVASSQASIGRANKNQYVPSDKILEPPPVASDRQATLPVRGTHGRSGEGPPVEVRFLCPAKLACPFAADHKLTPWLSPATHRGVILPSGLAGISGLAGQKATLRAGLVGWGSGPGATSTPRPPNASLAAEAARERCPKITRGQPLTRRSSRRRRLSRAGRRPTPDDSISRPRPPPRPR